MKYQSTKTYGNERGFSACFRQWRAETSHCRFLHGYSLGFRFVFQANKLDERNWVYDFGNCGWIKEFIEKNFDHKLAVAADDPELLYLKGCETFGSAEVVVMEDGVGCEKFAEYVYKYVQPIVKDQTKGRVHLKSVEVFEHGSNSAIYIKE
mgnify:FL=1|jgi:6-pyruvoyltetrahydropterin/6-carboxytetrahydropterin synthase